MSVFDPQLYLWIKKRIGFCSKELVAKHVEAARFHLLNKLMESEEVFRLKVKFCCRLNDLIAVLEQERIARYNTDRALSMYRWVVRMYLRSDEKLSRAVATTSDSELESLTVRLTAVFGNIFCSSGN